MSQGVSSMPHMPFSCSRRDSGLATMPGSAAPHDPAALPGQERQVEVLLALLEDCCSLLPAWMLGQAASSAAGADVAQVLSKRFGLIRVLSL